MPTYRELVDRYIDRSNSYIKTIDPKRVGVHMLDVQNLALNPKGADYTTSVGAAPAGADTLGPAKRVLERARAEGYPVFWSQWGLRPDGADSGIGKFKAPDVMSGKPDQPGSHGTWNGALCDGFDPVPGEPVIQKHRYSTFYGTPFNEWLAEKNVQTLVICGSSSANCVLATAQDGWNRNYQVIVLADTCTAVMVNRGTIELWKNPIPDGYGQHWEALRTIQASYADVMVSDEFFEMIDAAKAGSAK
jgi:nicotinamidase-related amidase